MQISPRLPVNAAFKNCCIERPTLPWFSGVTPDPARPITTWKCASATPRAERTLSFHLKSCHPDHSHRSRAALRAELLLVCATRKSVPQVPVSRGGHATAPIPSAVSDQRKRTTQIAPPAHLPGWQIPPSPRTASPSEAESAIDAQHL